MPVILMSVESRKTCNNVTEFTIISGHVPTRFELFKKC